jgi:hypothetical protein
MKITQIILVSILFTILGNLEIQAQKVSSKSRSSTPTATPQKSNAQTSTQKQLPPNTKTSKITGWAVEFRSILAAMDPYIGFNSTGFSIVMLPMPMNRYSPNLMTSGMRCEFDITNKLFREVEGVVARLQPQKWQTGYGENASIAIRVTITFHYKDDPSAVYETWWKGTNELPEDLRQILVIKDKVSADIKSQCQKEMNKR